MGKTQVETMPIAVYTAAESDLESAVVLSVELLAVSFAILLSPHRTFKSPVALWKMLDMAQSVGYNDLVDHTGDISVCSS